jgi:hypothetical protein
LGSQALFFGGEEMKSAKIIFILILIPLSFFLIKSFVYSTTDPSINDYSEIPLESDPRNIAINPYTDQAVVVGEKPNAVTITKPSLRKPIHHSITTMFLARRPKGFPYPFPFIVNV